MWTLTQSDPVLSAASPAGSGRLFTASGEGAESTREALAANAQREVTELYAERASELLSYALIMAREEELARDVLQEVFMRYFVARSNGDVIASPRAWLYRVLHNHMLDRMREMRSRNESGLEQVSAFIDHHQDVEGSYLREEVLAMARHALTPREFDCFLLRTQGLPYEEIAHELRLRCGTVGALISRSVRKVRRLVARPAGGVA